MAPSRSRRAGAADLPLLEIDPERPDLGALRRCLFDAGARNNRAVLPDQPPSPWRGQGDHGQGGEGMMGGKPYGRPMAMVGGDPDGLMLGALATSIGPFFPGLPAGLQVKVTLQGERISSVDEVVNWFPERPAAEVGPWSPDLDAALGRDGPAADLERARIATHLRTMAAVLDLAGLEAVAQRFLVTQTVEAPRLRRLFRAAEGRGLRRVLDGVGRIDRKQAEDLGLTGPVARASGLQRDGRSGEAAYRAVGFEPVTAEPGDVFARWCVLRDECLHAAMLIPELGERTTRVAEGPRGAWRRADGRLCGPSRTNLAALGQVLPGLLWSDALITTASLGLDMREAAIR